MGDPVQRDATHRITGLASRSHRTQRPAIRAGAVVGATAVLAAAVVGTVMLVRHRNTPLPTDVMADQITVSDSPTVPLTAPQILDLLAQPPEYGALADPQRRAVCLAGLGQPAGVQVLGAAVVDMSGAPAVVLVLPGDSDRVVDALLVRPLCNAADTGLIASTRVPRP